LKPTLPSSNISSLKGKNKSPSKMTSSPLTTIKRYKSDSNFEINQVLAINLASSESDLTRLINKGPKIDESVELLILPDQGQPMLKKNSSTT